MTNENGIAGEYAAQGHRFLRQAYEELEQDDLRQASEKGWGAATQIVKAAAEERGLTHDRHALLFGIARRLIEESDDDSLMRLFGSAGLLHENFYEGQFATRQVRVGLADVSEFVGKVENLLNGRNGASA